MPQYTQNKRPVVLNLDKHLSDLTDKEAAYILNHTSLLNIRSGKGGNLGPGKPLPANYKACDITQPAGETYTVGGYRSPLTKEVYSWHYNSNGVHYILRTSNNGCDIVYYDGCLEVSAEPRHSIENFRAYLAIEKICANRDGKQLIWVNGIGDINQLDVEASIATNNFTTPFFDRCANECAHIKMCVPDPCECLQAEWVPTAVADISLSNMMLDSPFQFIFKHVYYDGRESEWSSPSTTYYQSTKGCDTTAGFSRCIKLRVPVGNPFVDRIKIGFTTQASDETGALIWYETEIVEKYKKYNNAQEKWYDRDLAELANYSDTDCSFDYYFCNDRQRIPIDPQEISRVYNPIPRDVQGLINIREAIGFYNYVQGNCPIDKIQTEKFNITPDCSQAAQVCNTEYATITVRAIVINQEDNIAGLVFREGSVLNEPDDITVPAYFGTMTHTYSNTYGQKFNDTTRNFIAYIDGTDYWGEMKQWEASNGFSNNTEKGVISLPDSFLDLFPVSFVSAVSQYALSLKNSSKYLYQEAKIRVPKGQRGVIRIASHFQTSGAGSNQNTSTNVMGVFDIRDYVNGNNPYPITDQTVEEVEFDTCNGDVELFQTLFIRDESVDKAGGSAYSGYVKDSNDRPVEGAIVTYQDSSFLGYTDHNGYYHFYKDGADNADIYIWVEQDCGAFQIVKTTTITGSEGVTTSLDFTITEGNYENDMYANVVVPVRDCNGNPISGIRVSLTGSKYTITDSAGNATFKVRNYTARDRFVRAFALNYSGCFTKDCSDACNPCMPTSGVLLPACFSGVPTVTMGTLVLNIASLVSEINGLKAGGRYEWAIVIKGDCGRISAAYPRNFTNIPKTQEKGYLGFCEFAYDGTGMILPSWGKCLQILRSKNLNNYELQWKVDKKETTADGKIKLTIQSLNDYNAQYGFQTNTTYQWVKGDRIEFIYNGDGSILTTAVNGVLNYLVLNPYNDVDISGEQNDANFFNQLLLEGDAKLNGITEGAIFELQRPLPATSEQIYYSICASIPIVNGQLVYPTGTFSTFDTFLVNRTITSQSGSFVGTFEHHSPNDFWGNRVSDAGKRYVANRFENERRYGRNISINSPTVVNRFGDLVKRFEAPEQGDITAMTIIDGKIIMAICENDNFLAQSADELVRVGSDGIIRALPPDAIISDADPKIYGAYGCQYDDIGSVYFGDGFAAWVDSNKNVDVSHDFNAAKNISYGKTESYFRIRCRAKENHNSVQTDPLNKFRWATGFNFSTGELYRTLKTLRLLSINNEIRPFEKLNDTLIYHPDSQEYLGFASFTPEYFSQFDLNTDEGCAFVSYSQGVPYIHPVITDRFNEFFGIACDEVIWVTINKEPNKVKRAMAIEVKSEKRWFSKEVTTSLPNFISEIPPIKWKRENEKWSAGFLFNKNSRSGLYGNSKDFVQQETRGEWINCILIKNNTDQLKYNTIDNANRVLYNELGDIIVKFTLVEQTGMTENV